MEKMVIFLQTATGHECPGLGLPRECGGEVQLLESSEFGGKKLGVHQPKMVDFPGSEIGHFATWKQQDPGGIWSQNGTWKLWNRMKSRLEMSTFTRKIDPPGVLLNCHRGCIIFGPKNTWNKAFVLKVDMGWSENHDRTFNGESAVSLSI